MSLLACFFGLAQLHLDAVDTIDTVNEQYEDEDKGDLSNSCQCTHSGMMADEQELYLQAILQLGNDGIVGDEGENRALHRVG